MATPRAYLATRSGVPSPARLVPHLPLLERNGRVAIIAPASAPPDPARYTEGLEALRKRGLEVEATDPVRAYGYLAGPDEYRLDQLNDLLRRDDVDAILCARGGYGTLRLLPDIDYSAAAANPKLLVGYSDVTALQLALLARAGLPSLSGPMVAPDWSRMDPYTEGLFWSLAGGEAPVPINNPGDDPLWTLKQGEVEGMLVGGNLTMIASLLGTPYLPDLTGALLFVEEVGESPYRVDRLFAQLRLAGVLDQIGGLILGAFTGVRSEAGRPTLHLQEVIRHYASMVNGPVAGGLAYGHMRPKASLPVGVRAQLKTNSHAAFLTVTEPLTAP